MTTPTTLLPKSQELLLTTESSVDTNSKEIPEEYISRIIVG